MNKVFRSGIFAILLILCISPLPSQNLGKIDFPTSGSPAAQKFFIEGVLYLHNFEFEDAAEKFQKAREIDPDFAMAHWGEAMSANYPLWREVDLEAGRATLNRLGDTLEARLAKAPTEREKGYLRAVEALFGPGDKTARDLAYHEAMGRLHQKFPDDLEATAFYALSYLGLTDGTRDFRNYMRAGALAEEVFARNPEHPGAVHYMIHSYDDPIHAPLGLRAARVYAQIAPAASHAQHMVSHIFVAMGMWDDVVRANKISFDVADRRVEKKQLTVDDRNFHSLLWLHYGYLQQGRLEEARKVLEIMRTDSEKSGSERTRRHLALMRAAHIVETLNRDPIPGPVDHSDLGNRTVCADQFASAMEKMGAGDFAAMETIATQMEPCREEDATFIMQKQVRALLALKRGETEDALLLLNEATLLEDDMPFSFGPPVPAKPAHELLAETLLSLGRLEEAQVEFQKALERTPGRTLSLWGLAKAFTEAGDHERASALEAELQHIWRAADPEWKERSKKVSASISGGQ